MIVTEQAAARMMHGGETKEMRRMPVKTSRNTLTSRNTSSPRGQSHSYSERWDLSHLAEDPVQRFEALVGEIESMVAQFESARAQLSPTMAASIFHPLLTLSEDIAAAIVPDQRLCLPLVLRKYETPRRAFV